MRGQAHVTFKDIQCASNAMRALNGFEFFGKPMVCGILFYSSKNLSTDCLVSENSIRQNQIRHHSQARRHVQNTHVRTTGRSRSHIRRSAYRSPKSRLWSSTSGWQGCGRATSGQGQVRRIQGREARERGRGRRG